MKNLPIIIVFISFLCAKVIAQKRYFVYDQPNIETVHEIESTFDSKKITPVYKIVTANNQKIKHFKRPENLGFPPALVDYFYLENGTTVNHIDYRWKINASKEAEQTETIQFFNTEFDWIVNLISKEIGEPKPNQGEIRKSLEQLIGNASVERKEREVIWEYKNCIVVTKLIWAENHGQDFFTSIYWK